MRSPGIGHAGLEVRHRHPARRRAGRRARCWVQPELGPVGRRCDGPRLSGWSGWSGTHVVSDPSWAIVPTANDWQTAGRSEGRTGPMPKRALITGITGQDGSYLAELLLDKGYEVIGMVRRIVARSTSSASPTSRTASTLVPGDLLDEVSLIDVLRDAPARRGLQPGGPVVRADVASPSRCSPARSPPSASPACSTPSASSTPTSASTRRQSSEMFGKVVEVPQTETTPFYPRSPYGVAKVYGHWITDQLPRELRPARLARASSSTTRSPRRGLEFVTRKITHAVARIKLGLHERAAPRQPRRPARLGLRRRLRRGHVADAPAGRARRLRGLPPARPTRCASSASWPSTGSASTGRTTSSIDEQFFRPAEVDLLIGDPSQGPHDARLEARDVASRSWST